MGKPAQPPRLEAHSNGTWYIIFTGNGRSQRVSTRTKDIQEAQEVFAGWLIEHKAFEAAPDGRLRRVSECLDIYLEQHAEPNIERMGNMTASFRYLHQFFADYDVADLTRQVFDSYVRARKTGVIGGRVVGDGTVRLDLSYLRAAINFAADKAEPRSIRLSKDHLPDFKLPDKPEARERVLTSEELKAITEGAKNLRQWGIAKWGVHPDKISPLELYVALLMETGCRSRAAMDLTWDRVDFAARLIRYNPYGRKQTRKRRPIVPMSDYLHDLLKQAKQESRSPYVCGGKFKLDRNFANLVDRLGIEGVTPHTMRHTWATEAIAGGISIEKAAEMLGDTYKTVYENYCHLQPDHLRDAVDRMSELRQGVR